MEKISDIKGKESVFLFAGASLVTTLMLLFSASCGETAALRFTIDENAAAFPRELPGLFDEKPRPLSVLVPEDGPPVAFVSNELVVMADSVTELEAMAGELQAELLLTMDAQQIGISGHPCLGLLRIEPPRGDGIQLAQASRRLTEKHQPVRPDGNYRLTSAQGLGLLALAAREAEAGRQVAVNWLFDGGAIPYSTREADSVPEMLPSDAYQWPNLMLGGGYDFGVTEAWSLLHRARRLENHVRVAVIDSGFSNREEPLRDLLEHNAFSVVALKSPYGSNLGFCGNFSECPWHGQNVASAIFARVDDGFGGAGSAGPVATPLLINSLYDYFTANVSVLLARGAGAKIISMSFTAPIPTIVAWTIYPFETTTALLRASGTLLFAGAGNEGADVDSGDCLGAICWEYTWYTPCENDGVICVGGLGWNSQQISPNSNYGEEAVVIYGPFSVLAGPDPDHTGNIAQLVHGTSFATPWTAGTAALVWAANPSLSAENVARAVLDNVATSPDWYRPRLRMARPDQAVMAALRAVAWLAVSSPAAGLEIQTERRFNIAGHVTFRTYRYSDSSICRLTANSNISGHILDSSFTLPTSHYRTYAEKDFSFDTATGLPPGRHRLTVTVQCGDTQASDDDSVEVEINVKNTPPTVQILQPADNVTICAGAELLFRGNATDPEEVSPGLPDSAFKWYSAQAGLLGTGRFLTTTRLVTPGTDTITLTATDKYGATGSASITVNVLLSTLPVCSDAAPRVKITSPLDNQIFYVTGEDANGWYVALTLKATASDEEDPPNSLIVYWSSNRQGSLGQGPERPVRLYLYQSPETVHLITARVQDSAGHTAQDTIRVSVSTITK